ncbi:UNVERIFIED_CONTAM: multidrug resistance efflux transporter family protein [Halobacillus marinus]
MKELLLGIISSMFFAVTFILNRSMELDGGSWMWSASLRFLFMIPFLFFIVLGRRNLLQVFSEMKQAPLQWLTWSFVGFVLFYAPLTYAAAYGPGWLVAGTWQMTIVAGILIAPLIVKGKGVMQWRALAISSIILFGVFLIQFEKAADTTFLEWVVGVLPVLVACFAYPLGNRKMMAVCGDRLDTFQRIFGMTLASLPFWLVLSAIAGVQAGAPSSGQVVQSLIVAVSSGIIATTLFFFATNRVQHHQGKLAAVEATQSTQILFVIVGEAWLLSSPLPSGLALLGVCLIMIGIVIHTLFMSFLNKQASPVQALSKAE